MAGNTLIKVVTFFSCIVFVVYSKGSSPLKIFVEYTRLKTIIAAMIFQLRILEFSGKI